MRERKVLLALLFMINLASMGIMAINPVSAQGPSVFTTTATGVDTEVFGRVVYQGTVDVYVRIKDAPHQTSETDPDPHYGGASPTDLTWSYEITVRWDTAVLALTSARILEPLPWWTSLGAAPDTAGTHTSFLRWARWDYDIDLGWLPTTYENAWIAGIPEPGLVAVTMYLQAQNPDKVWNYYALPTMSGWPDEGAHTGAYYDLPYSRTTLPYAINTPNNDLLVRLRFQNLDTGGTTGTAWSKIDIEGYLLTIGQTKIIPTIRDAWYGAKPVPEFPLGLAPILMLAPLILIVYLWRTRKKVMKQ